MFFLPGLPVLYQGDELGLLSIELKQEELADPVATRNAIESDGRDGARTPMPWGGGSEFGFTEGVPWIPIGNRTYEDTVEYQQTTRGSWLMQYRKLLSIRKENLKLDTPLRWITARNNDVISFSRGNLISALNVGVSDQTISLPQGDWNLVFYVGEVSLNDMEVTFGENSAAVLVS